MTLKETKDIIAKKHGYLSWQSLNAYGAVIPLNLFDEVAELYAESKVKKISFNLPVMRSAFSAGEAYQLWHNDKLEEEQPNFEEWIKKHFA